MSLYSLNTKQSTPNRMGKINGQANPQEAGTEAKKLPAEELPSSSIQSPRKDCLLTFNINGNKLFLSWPVVLIAVIPPFDFYQ